MRNKIISKIESCGFKVDNRGQIFKFSNSTKSKEKAGQLNERSVYFYAQNVSPFNFGTNSFKQILGNDFDSTAFTPYVKKQKTKQDKRPAFTFQDYISSTKTKNQFSLFLKQYTNKNPYDIRGVKNGYLEDAVLFPYIDYNDKFDTAKIVKYNSKTGKRIKGNFTNNWFHSYKPIKKELGFLDNNSKGANNCYFGEHLLKGNNKPVVIVEAEKTAILLSFLYNDIVFIATGGIHKLKTLDASFLLNRNVYVFPDNNATEWIKIANKRNWWCSLILENKGTKGSDAADYFDTEIGEEIAAELYDIVNGKIKVDKSNINFSIKEKRTKKYCSPYVKNLGLNYYIDNSKDINYKRGFVGTWFTIYENEFNVLSANVDFNKYEYEKNENGKLTGKLVPVDAAIFTSRLERTFRVLKRLNSECVLKKFEVILNHLLENSNYLFNREYVITELLPMWDNDDNDVSEYKKVRNWIRQGNQILEDDEFIQKRNNDLLAFRTNRLLVKLRPLLSKNKYIKADDIGLRTRQQNGFVWDLIKDYNLNVLGCSTINNYNEKLKINSYMNFVYEMTESLLIYDNEIKTNTFLYNKSCSIYNSTYIVCNKNSTSFKNPSITSINDNTLVHKSIIREYLNFRPKENTLRDIITQVDFLIENHNNIDFKRIKTLSKNGKTSTRIEIILKHTIVEITNKMQQQNHRLIYETSLKTAFDYDLDLTDSILNVDESEAIQRGDDFLYSWIIFNTPEKTFTDNEKELIKLNPLLFLNNTTMPIAS